MFVRRCPGKVYVSGELGFGGETYLIDAVDPKFLKYGMAGNLVGSKCQ